MSLSGLPIGFRGRTLRSLRGRPDIHGIRSRRQLVCANSVLFQCAILAYNAQRWMALCSGDQLLRRWEPATLRAFIIRVGGLFRTGSRQ
ncbi:MAG: hypothetical protein Q7U64_00805 [Desulfocapsaceae bacterium]|nr:hypothetical protein [Desulfocapsaceae bacterium]